MRRPSFQFYPADWLGNTKLRRCIHAEKGVWIDVMCLMHDSEAYGVLHWPLKDIAAAVGCKVSVLKSLAAKGVLKGDDKRLSEAFTYTPRSGGKDGPTMTLIPAQNGPIWYSSRMVRDEHVRRHRGEATRFSTNVPKPTPMASPKPPYGYGSSSSSSSTVPSQGQNPPSQEEVHSYEEDF